MTAAEILRELTPLASASYKKTLLNHGIPEPLLGVKISDLKTFQKRIRKDYQLALDLYDTGTYDARYLAGLIADESRMTKKDLRHWLRTANSPALGAYVVAPVAAETPHAPDLAREWIDSPRQLTALTGWDTLSSLVSLRPDAELDLPELQRLLDRVRKTIHAQPDRVRYAMNTFVISLGTYVHPLTQSALDAAHSIGQVSVDMGNTACQVPSAPAHIQKARSKGPSKKRRSARC
jgi:3-methyladenine DNA glycosylase AlkD